MKKILLIALTTFAFVGNANAEITTKKQADLFIDQFCITLVNTFSGTLEQVRKEQVRKEEARMEGAEDELISENLFMLMKFKADLERFVDIYSKLCK